MKINLPTLLLGLTLSWTALPALAADSGQFDLNALASSAAVKPKVNINFGPALMKGFAETLRQSNPQLADILQGVSGMRLMVFESFDSQSSEPEITRVMEQLGRGGWNQAVTIADEETRINLFLMESDEFVTGLVLLLRDGPDTAVFANIHGNMDPVTIGKLIGGGQGVQGFDLGGLIGQFQGQGK